MPDTSPIEEPLWRQILNWGLIIYFLGLPALAIFLGFTHASFGSGTNIAKFLSEFHFAVTALLGAIAGLNSFDRYKASNGKEHRAPEMKKAAL
jgi:hypothetical protein